ncbi:MAG: CBS domain-containing protein [Bacillota bacterium]
MLDKDGHYLGTLTEGDLLWKLKNSESLDFQHTHKVMLRDIPHHTKSEPITVNSEIEDIVNTSLYQNFVPVIDDFGVFIGIIRRREMIELLSNLLEKNDEVGVN